MRGSVLLLAALVLCSCASYQPSCADNPRNMSCMSASQLERELGTETP